MQLSPKMNSAAKMENDPGASHLPPTTKMIQIIFHKSRAIWDTMNTKRTDVEMSIKLITQMLMFENVQKRDDQ